jgi:hypothetical protein
MDLSHQWVHATAFAVRPAGKGPTMYQVNRYTVFYRVINGSGVEQKPVRALSPNNALKIAKEMGIFAPMVEPMFSTRDKRSEYIETLRSRAEYALKAVVFPKEHNNFLADHVLGKEVPEQIARNQDYVLRA